ncbi:MAG: transcription antitermination factor NusB [Candidatus Krumholzibacteriota bacterium]
MKADPVRLRAHDVLMAVDQGRSLDQELAPRLNNLADPRDRAFLAELVRGTLQWQGRYDHLIRHFASRKPPTDSPTLCLLRLSLHQMLGLDSVPAFAAIHQAGELCRRRPGARKVPFINGLLRNVKRQVMPDRQDEKTSAAERENRLRRIFEETITDRAARLAAWQSHPLWLVRKWIAAYGWETAEAVCSWNNRPVPLVFHVLAPMDPEKAVAILAEAGCRISDRPRERVLVSAERIGRARLDEILGQNPWLIVQDPTVQAATAWLAGRPADESAGGDFPVLDMCAAPGGKTAFLAASWPGICRIVAMDNRPGRIRLLTSTVKRIETDRVDVLLADGRRPPFGPGTFGAVLLDGPCSGTGVLRHHPEGRWKLKAGVPAHKGAVLRELAGRAADLLAPGGLLMYATCSLEPEENEDVVDHLLARRDDLEPAPDDAGRWRRTWMPGDLRGDGFFAARLRKKG